MVGPSESKNKTSSSTPDSKAARVVVTKASSSGKPSNRVVIGSLPETITPSRLKELLQAIGPIQVDTATTLACWNIENSLIFFDRKPRDVKHNARKIYLFYNLEKKMAKSAVYHICYKPGNQP